MARVLLVAYPGEESGRDRVEEDTPGLTRLTRDPAPITPRPHSEPVDPFDHARQLLDSTPDPDGSVYKPASVVHGMRTSCNNPSLVSWVLDPAPLETERRMALVDTALGLDPAYVSGRRLGRSF
jgi:hypothetical protein